MPVKIVALITVKPGHEAEVEGYMQALVAGSRGEPGNLRYDLWREPGGDGRYIIDELYVDHAATDAHRASAHYIAFRTAIGGLFASPPQVVTVEAIDIAA
jgi:quinol monooxygenase YgiN